MQNNLKVHPQYLAGFFDGEGSMFVQIRYRASYALRFGIFYVLTFSQNNLSFNNWLKTQLNEFGEAGQRDLMYEIKELHNVMKTPEDLLKIAQLADAISALNYHSTHVQGSYSLKIKEFHNL